MMDNPREALNMIPKGPNSYLNGRMFNGKQIYNRFDNVIDEGIHLQDAVLPDLPKIVRLAFHDCLPDSETGGCNGCLNFSGMGHEGEGVLHQGCNKNNSCKADKASKETNNNNLVWAARALEMIYEKDDLTVPLFKKSTPAMYKDIEGFSIQGSLRENGKSRADLWAFAALTAVELGIQYHNSLCDSRNMTNYCGGNPDNDGCVVELPLPNFKFGRKDCTLKCEGENSFYGFCTPAEESHPDPHGNGGSVTSFFRKEFKLTGRESVALMGAHTLGHANEQISGFHHYPWAFNFGRKTINNDYYKILVNPDGWRRKNQQSKLKWDNKCKNQKSTFVGDEQGKPLKVYWVTRSQWQNNDGGPWNWNSFGKKCDPRVCKLIGGNLTPTSCCHYFDKRGRCTTDKSKCKKHFCNLKTDKFNCTIPSFMGSSMMNIDMGLYVQFDIAQGDKNGIGHGRPAGCEGLNSQHWLTNKQYRQGQVYTDGKLPTFTEAGYLDYSSKNIQHGVASAKCSDVVSGKRFSGCDLNTAKTENGQMMHEIVEEYASDNSLFIKDFSAVLQKMISNGYQRKNPKGNKSLKKSNWKWANMRCSVKFCIVKS